MKRITIILISLLLMSEANAQADTTYEEIMSQLLEDNLGEVEESDIIDEIEELLDNPIDINNASHEDLLRIPLLDNRRADAIIRYRESHGSFDNKNELFLVPELNDKIARWISHFIAIAPAAQSENIFSYSKITLRSRIQRDLQLRRAYAENKFAGNRLKSYNRILYYGDYISAGILTEKDPGEKSYTDFISGFMQINTKTFLNKIIIGNYIVESGCGLILWSPYNYRKGSEVIIPISNFRNRIRPYKSSGEYGYLSGLTASLSSGIIEFTPFVSFRKLDASLDSNGNIKSFRNDGYHRSTNELDANSNAKEFTYGALIKFNPLQDLSVGLTAVSYNYDKDIALLDSRHAKNLSVNFAYGNSLLNVSGETAFFKNYLSSITSAVLTPVENIKLGFSYRNYSPDFYSITGNSFGEKTKSTNEKGFYSSIELNTNYGLFSVYYDIYYFPNVNNNFPSKGQDFLAAYKFRLNKTSSIKLLYKNESNEKLSNDETYPYLDLQNRKRCRIELINYFKDKVRLKTRFEYVRFSSSSKKERGFLIYQDALYKPFDNLAAYARIVFFDTDSYDTRLYVYENDLEGLLTNGLIYGEGIKWYFLIKYAIRQFSISLKYSELYKPFEEKLGSGYSEIGGSIDNRISFQIDYAMK
ncbi:ComEA family DNA-binding protein [Melioribacter sp. Ez-97]|uniref:ComEA family DNA-binding protein n=1 Tax=Melioribacter sp. Ez-97 TaxID=3423434 RepID=UPI003ED8EAC2